MAATAPACVACGFTLRWVPEQLLWGCDRCRASYPVARPAAHAPSLIPASTLPDALPAGEQAGQAARRRTTLLWVLLALVLAAGGVVAYLAFGRTPTAPARPAIAQVTAPSKPPAQVATATTPADAAIPVDAPTVEDAPEADPPEIADAALPPPHASGSSGMPHCDAYRTTILALSKCPKLPKQTRDALKTSFDQASKAWASLPESSRQMVDNGCRQANGAMQQSLTSFCK